MALPATFPPVNSGGLIEAATPVHLARDPSEPFRR